MSLKVDASHAEKFNGNGNHENCDVKELMNSSTKICRFVLSMKKNTQFNDLHSPKVNQSVSYFQILLNIQILKFYN